MKTIKIVFASLIIILQALTSKAQDEEQRLVIPLSNPGGHGKLKVEIIRGSIDVMAYNGKEVIVIAKKGSTKGVGDTDFLSQTLSISFNSLDAAIDAIGGIDVDEDINEAEKEKLEKIKGMKKIKGSTMELTATESNNVVILEAESWRSAIDLEIKVPHDFDLQCSTVHGEFIRVNGAEKEISLSNVQGDIILNAIKGNVDVNTTNGKITAEFEKFDATSPMAFSTMNGDIELIIPARANASLKMKTTMGEIYTDFNFDIRKAEPTRKKDDDDNVYKVSIEDWIYGDINKGGEEVMIKSFNGDILIREK
jgi:DUF4097 and DUF4098 domain-containing protein YvlB